MFRYLLSDFRLSASSLPNEINRWSFCNLPRRDFRCFVLSTDARPRSCWDCIGWISRELLEKISESFAFAILKGLHFPLQVLRNASNVSCAWSPFSQPASCTVGASELLPVCAMEGCGEWCLQSFWRSGAGCGCLCEMMGCFYVRRHC